jgi:hypothetical protein
MPAGFGQVVNQKPARLGAQAAKLHNIQFSQIRRGIYAFKQAPAGILAFWAFSHYRLRKQPAQKTALDLPSI